MTSWIFTLILWVLFLNFPLPTWAQYKRTVTVEWEMIDGAAHYDVEWIKVPAAANEQPLRVQVSGKPSWSGPMAPGIYQMRIRALDRRKVPGDWSASEEFKVGLDPVQRHTPLDGSLIATAESEKENVRFQWSPVQGAEKYLFEIQSEDGSFHFSQETTTAEWTFALAVAQKYTWSVKAQASENIVSEKAQILSFSLMGKKLDTPIFQEMDTLGMIKWSRPSFAETFDIALSKKDSASDAWQPVEKIQASSQSQIRLKENWIDGVYLIQVKAHSPLRESSDTAVAQFRVDDSNRQAIAEREAFQLREKWDRREGYFAILRQQVGLMDYTSNNVDLSENANFAALGGFARLSTGHFGKGRWGGSLSAEVGGVYLDGRSYTASTIEVTAINRQTSETGEVRHSFGPFFKELPMISSANTETHTVDRASAIGPHYGYEWSRTVAGKAGVLMSFDAFMNLIKVRAPSEQNAAPSISLQTALMGTYRLTETATGFYGYTYRMDSLAFGPAANSIANNNIMLKGHFLNFYLEWSL